MSYVVTQQTREIGIRIALGAEPQKILRMVITRGVKLALIGVAIGLVASFALTRFLSSLLYNTSPTDPLTFATVAVALIAVAVAASPRPHVAPCKSIQSAHFATTKEIIDESIQEISDRDNRPDLDAELQSHLQMSAADHQDRGATPKSASASRPP